MRALFFFFTWCGAHSSIDSTRAGMLPLLLLLMMIALVVVVAIIAVKPFLPCSLHTVQLFVLRQ